VPHRPCEEVLGIGVCRIHFDCAVRAWRTGDKEVAAVGNDLSLVRKGGGRAGIGMGWM
jgi:hypothetical protein